METENERQIIEFADKRDPHRPGAMYWDSNKGAWYARIRWKNQRIHRKLLGPNQRECLRLGQRLADEFRGSIDDPEGALLAGMRKSKARSEVGTVGQYLSYYPDVVRESINRPPKDRTIRDNVGNAKRLLELSGWRIPGDLDTLITEITADKLDKGRELYVRLRQDQARPGESEVEWSRAVTTTNTYMRSWKSIFQRRYWSAYEAKGLAVPEDHFRTFAELTQTRGAQDHRVAVSDDVVAATFEGIETFRAVDPNMFLTFWVTVGFPHRRSTIYLMKWEDFKVVDGRMTYIGLHPEKNNLRVQAPCACAEARLALESFRKPSGNVIVGSEKELNRELPKRFREWMHDLGWPNCGPKGRGINELRAWVLTQMQAAEGAEKTAIVSGHRTPAVLRKHYRHHIRADFKERSLEQMVAGS